MSPLAPIFVDDPFKLGLAPGLITVPVSVPDTVGGREGYAWLYFENPLGTVGLCPKISCRGFGAEVVVAGAVADVEAEAEVMGRGRGAGGGGWLANPGFCLGSTDDGEGLCGGIDVDGGGL